MRNICIKLGTDWRISRHRNDDTLKKRPHNDRITDVYVNGHFIKKSFTSIGQNHRVCLDTIILSLRTDKKDNEGIQNILKTVASDAERSRASLQSRASFHSLMRLLINAMSQKLVILSIRLIEQIKGFFLTI